MRIETMAALLLLAPVATLAAQDTTTMRMPPRDTIGGFNTPQATNRGDTLQGDNAILMKIHRINQMEIEAGQLAQRNSSTAKVKSYGQQLVRDHQSSDKKVTALAQRLGVTLRDKMDTTGQRAEDRRWQQNRDSMPLPDTTNRPGWQQRADTTDRQGAMKQHGDSMKHGHDQDAVQDHALMQQLQTLRGTQFDAVFANAMARGHDKAIKLLEQAQSQVQNTELRTLIQSTLPTLRRHLQVAQSLGGSTTTTTSTSSK